MPLLKGVEKYQLTAGAFPYVRRRSPSVLILKYHRVCPVHDAFAIDAVTTDEFEQHLKAVLSLFRVISLDQLVEELDSNALSEDTVCITFDDGYRDNFEHAFPMLKKYGVPATIFLATDMIESGKMLWHDMVLVAAENAQVARFCFEDAGIEEADFTILEVRCKTAFTLLSWLKTFSPDKRDEKIKQIIYRCQTDVNCFKNPMLRWGEIKEMQEAGVCFGAHTKRHPILSMLTDEEMEDEILGSKLAIENVLNSPVLTFSYPNGRSADFDERCRRLLIKHGFRCAVTTRWGVNTVTSDLYELNRINIWDHNINRVCARLLLSKFSNKDMANSGNA